MDSPFLEASAYHVASNGRQRKQLQSLRSGIQRTRPALCTEMHSSGREGLAPGWIDNTFSSVFRSCTTEQHTRVIAGIQTTTDLPVLISLLLDLD